MNYVSISSPGKCILFGEHSVVYGYPAIAMAISLNSICTIEKISQKKIIIVLRNYNKKFISSNLNNLKSQLLSQFPQFYRCFEIFKNKFKINFKNLCITISSSLFPSSGLGSSASISVALISAISQFYNLNFKKKDISELAFELEKIVHGTPSGIDNTICTYGNLIYYQSGKFEFLSIPRDLKLLVSYTNIEHNTKEAIERIKLIKKEKPEYSNKLLGKMGLIAENAKEELKKGNLIEIGKLMNENQNYLEKMKVSTDAISEITNIAVETGAFGSKLTGAGLGGCVITLGKKKILRKIYSKLNDKGYKSFLTNIDRIGVKNERKK
ncbi:MAG: mevalonate kinase [Promethearchaeota archaeon]